MPETIVTEFETLKSELIGPDLFVIPRPEDSAKWARYNQLVGYFHGGITI